MRRRKDAQKGPDYARRIARKSGGEKKRTVEKRGLVGGRIFPYYG